jgi:hypothetical protein
MADFEKDGQNRLTRKMKKTAFDHKCEAPAVSMNR